MRGSVGAVLTAALFTGVARADELDYMPKGARMLLDAIKVSVHADRVEAEATVEYAPAIEAFLSLTGTVERKTVKSKRPWKKRNKRLRTG